jgi:dihydropteroate synthase
MRPLIVGILNVTPDSFSDGGRFAALDAAVAAAHTMVEDGADVVDIGGESTRPGAEPVGAEDEWARVGPVLEALRGLSVPLSVDTQKASVAARAARAGARWLNDVGGLQDDEMAAVSADFEDVVVMHMRGTPQTMASLTAYADLHAEVSAHLARGLERSRARRTWVDPGIGFAKTPAQSLEVLGQLRRYAGLGAPLYVGASRKRFIAEVCPGRGTGDRLAGSLAAVSAGLAAGAAAFRVHDVRPTADFLAVSAAIARAGALADARRPS